MQPNFTDSQMRQSPRSGRGYILFLSIIALLAIFLFLVMVNSFLCDDAFITFRFSKHLASGIGPVYNPGERVEGYTNFFWMILMALVIKLGGAPPFWSRIVAACFSLATLGLFLYHVARDSSRNRAIGIIFIVFLIFSSPFIAWTSGGLETAAFAFFIFAAILTYVKSLKEEKGRLSVISSLLFTLAAITRPEGVLAFSLAVGFLLAAVLLKKANLYRLVEFILPFLILYGIYFIWRFIYYGKLFPNTFYIKEPSSLLIPLGVQYYERFLIGCPIWIPLVFAIILAIRARLRGLSFGDYYIGTLFLVYSGYIIYVGGDFLDLWRFIMPLLAPFFLMLFHFSADDFRARLSKFELAIAVAALLIFAGFNYKAIQRSRSVSYDYNVDSIGALRNYVTEWSSVAKLLGKIGRPVDTLAITAAGIIPYYTDMYTIDMYGLEAANLSQYGQLKTFNRPGHRMTISLKYLYDNKPHYMVAHPVITDNQPRYFPFSQAQDLYPALLKEYTPVSMELPDLPGRYLNFRIRNDIVGKISHEMKTYKVDYWDQ